MTTFIENADEQTEREITANKHRINNLSQELWTATEFEHRQAVLMMLASATTDLLLMESNRENRLKAKLSREEMLQKND